MLKTHTKEIDGFEIITAFSSATIDPVATQKGVKPMIAKHKQVPAIEGKKRSSNDLQQKIGVINREATILWHDKTDIQKIADELIVLNGEVREDEKQLLRDNPVFFECNAGEYRFDAETTSELMSKFLAKSDTEQIDIEGETVADYRGKLFHLLVNGKWEKQTISKLAELPGEIEISDCDLSDEQLAEIEAQKEKERISKLMPVDKQKEINLAIDSAAGEAALMRNKLEIQGDVDALEKSQEFYQSEVEAINLKYRG